MKKYLVLLTTTLFTTALLAQRGKDGNKTVAAASTLVNEYTTLITDANAGQSTIAVASNTLSGVFAAPLAKGDLILIIQMQGATIDFAPDDNTYGAITNYNNAGNNELAEVLSVSGTQQITLLCGLKNSYTATGHVQVVRVPRYNTLTINSGADISCPTWDGTKGGVVAIEVLGQTTINGKILATGKGFRSGKANENEATFGVTGSRSGFASYGGEKGEGIAGYVTDYDTMNGRYSFGAPANGGGGGNGHNAGGGGGANAGDINVWTGKGNPDLSTANWAQAWDLEGNNFSTSTSSGGGKGGYTFSSNNQNALTTPLYTSAWGGDWRNNVGGRGGRPLDYSTGHLFLGGGGGAGDQNDGTGGDGGNGGGLIYLVSFGNVSGTGAIESNGAAGENSGAGITQGQDGAGGGGAGGTIIVNAKGQITTISITANGGEGGDLLKIVGNDCYGPGGGGGGGYIATTATNVSKSAAGGTNGTTTVVTMSEFPANGATKGSTGNTAGIVSLFDITANGDTACAGQTVTLTALVSGTAPVGYTVDWRDDTGNIVGNGESIQYTFNTPQTLYVNTCPGWFSIPVALVGGTEPTAAFAYADSGGFNAHFFNNSTNATSYNWNFGDGNTSTNAAPVHDYASEGTYTVTLIAINPCGADTFTANVTVIKVSLNENAPQQLTIISGNSPNTYYLQGINTTCTEVNYSVTDLSGRILAQKQLFNSNALLGPIDLASYSQGLYVVSFNCNSKLFYGKLLVK